MAPRDHRIHLGGMDSHEFSPKTNSLTNSFRDPKIDRKTSTGKHVDLGVSKSNPGLPNPTPERTTPEIKRNIGPMIKEFIKCIYRLQKFINKVVFEFESP